MCAVPLTFGCSVLSAATTDGGPSFEENVCPCEVGLCVDGLCQARTTELDTLLAEVNFPSGLAVVPGQKFVTLLSGIGRGDDLLDIQLDSFSRIVGAIKGAPVSTGACVPLPEGELPALETDGSVPARITLLPRTRLLGLNAPVTVVESVSDGVSNVFSAAVSPGAYDLYVEPSGSDVACRRPPYLVVNQLVKPGDIELKLTLPEPKVLSLVVELAGEEAFLDGFEVAVVESATGRVLSNVEKLGEPLRSESTVTYGTSLAYTTVQGALTTKVHELVRLSPPEGVDFPTLYVERAVAELFQPGTATISQVLELPRSIVVRGSVAGKSLGAKLRFVAQELPFLTPGTLFSYLRETDVASDGSFEVELLPGRYRILVEPEAPDVGQRSVERTFEESESGVELSPGAPLFVESRALSVLQTPHAGVPFDAAPVPPLSSFSSMFGAASTPRPFYGSTVEGGAFSATLDPGEYTLTFRPDPSTGFPWVVLPSVRVAEGTTSFLNPQGSLPVALRGRVIAADAGEVPSATVRFYALLSGDRLVGSLEEATRAVPVAEARARDGGTYRVLLPSRIANSGSSSE